jgi:hypothetical protein
VDLSVNVRLGVVDDVVDVSTRGHAVIGAQRIGVESRTEFDVLSDGLLKLILLPVADDLGTDAAPSPCRSSKPITATLSTIERD